MACVEAQGGQTHRQSHLRRIEGDQGQPTTGDQLPDQTSAGPHDRGPEDGASMAEADEGGHHQHVCRADRHLRREIETEVLGHHDEDPEPEHHRRVG